MRDAHAGRPPVSHPINEHVIEMGEVPRVPKTTLSARHGSQDIPLLNVPVCRTLLSFTIQAA